MEKRTLMGDKSQGKELNNQMKIASDLVKAKNYRAALKMYMEIYVEYSSFSALYNASVMHEALGNVPAAIECMEKAAKETGNPDAMTEVVRLKKIIRDRETIAAVRATDGPIEKVIRYASREALKSMPDGARVSFFNNSERERDLASQVIEGMTNAFKQFGGVTIVDNENTQRIERELQLQYSGVVSDDNIVTVGNQVGVNTMITVEITGVGGNRRLKLTVLDIETRKPLLQSDGSSNWEL